MVDAVEIVDLSLLPGHEITTSSANERTPRNDAPQKVIANMLVEFISFHTVNTYTS